METTQPPQLTLIGELKETPINISNENRYIYFWDTTDLSWKRSQLLSRNTIFKIPSKYKIVLSRPGIENDSLGQVNLEAFNKKEFSLPNDTDAPSITLFSENNTKIAPILQKRCSTLDEGLSFLQKIIDKLIREKKEIEDKPESVKTKADLAIIERVLGNTKDVKKAQSERFQEGDVVKMIVSEEQVKIDIHFDQLAYPVYLKLSDGLAARTLFPTRECILTFTHSLRKNTIFVSTDTTNVTPHISGGGTVCLGTFEGALIELAQKKDYSGVINMLADYLCTYNNESPFTAPCSFFSEQSLNLKKTVNFLLFDLPHDSWKDLIPSGKIRKYFSNKTTLELLDILGEKNKNILLEKIAELKQQTKIPTWLTAKTGLSCMFDVLLIEETFLPKNEKVFLDRFSPRSINDFNRDIFNLIIPK